MALVDLTNSGKLDAIVPNQYDEVAIYRNILTKPKKWVGLKLIGDGKICNRDAIGTRVQISYRDQGRMINQMREVTASNGFAAQSDGRLLFGLGAYNGELSADILWCGTAKQRVALKLESYNQIRQIN